VYLFSHLPAASGRVRGAVRRAAAALRHIHREQNLMWELWWQANRASVPSSGPLTWVLTLDGHRLAGCHLPTARGDAAERAR
jgi:hypothetical protein